MDYVKSCTTCTRSKAKQHKPYGLLYQLPVPLRPWESISMDFIEQLPDSEGFTAILVVVDRFTKQALFIPTHDTITSTQLTELFIIHVFSKHGVPSHVTSDRGSEFVSRFFHSFGKALNMNLHFTSGYHPEGDGQTERVNQTLEQFIVIFNRITGILYYPLQNSFTTTLQVPLQEYHHSLLTRVTIQLLLFIPNMNLLL
jgi:hypothetical protein